MSVSRRSLFGRAAGVAALGAVAPSFVGGAQGATSMGNSATLGYLAKDSAVGYLGNSGQLTNAMKPVLFTSFADWWTKHGEKDAMRQSEGASFPIDPDIAEFRLPAATKMRMQRERWLMNVKRASEREFRMRLKFGPWEYWGGDE